MTETMPLIVATGTDLGGFSTIATGRQGCVSVRKFCRLRLIWRAVFGGEGVGAAR